MKILHLDIETAPHRVYAWGLWGQDIAISQIEEPGYTMCWAAKWHGKRGLMFDSIHHSGMKAMLQGIHDLIDEADACVHYNGRKFDMPTLNGEFLRHDLKPPATYKDIDLLLTARKRFKLASNKLDYVAQHLGLGAKVKHRGMELWRDCMAGDDKAWREMARYNKQDVALLERVYLKLMPWIDGHPNVALYDEDEPAKCINCGSKKLQRRGYAYTTTQRYPRFQCQNCGKWLRGRANETPQHKAVLAEAR